MEREKVKSSNLASVGYDDKTMTLEVEFKGGGVYQYTGVMPAMYRSLMDAKSKGKFFALYIKDVHPFKKL